MMAEVLLAASSRKSADTLSSMLAEHGIHEICVAETEKNAWKMLQDEIFSLVIIFSPFSDGSGCDLARSAAETASGVIVVCKPENYDGLYSRLFNSGVFVLSTDMGRRMFYYAVDIMRAVHLRLSNAVPQTERLQQKIKDIRMIDRAKCCLIQYEHMTEDEAHRYIEKEAMDRRTSKRSVAEDILGKYSG